MAIFLVQGYQVQFKDGTVFHWELSLIYDDYETITATALTIPVSELTKRLPNICQPSPNWLRGTPAICITM